VKVNGKDPNDLSITHSADNSPKLSAALSPRRRFSFTKVISARVSPHIDRESAEREESPRLSLMFRNKSGSKAKQTSATVSETILKQVKSSYPVLCQNNHDDARVLVTEKVNDLERIQYLLEQFSSLNEGLIAKRNMLLDNEKNDLDVFVYQNLPPHLVYLYCQAMLKSGLSEKWLVSLMNASEEKIANTLIYIATRLELARENVGAEILFRENSFANQLSVCYSKIDIATVYLNQLIAKIIQLIRNSTVYDITQKFDVLDEAFKDNFRRLIAKIADIIVSIEYQETIATILSLRYRLVSECFDAATAATSAQSLFGLRVFVPPFRLCCYSEGEKLVVIKITALMVKASSDTHFESPTEDKLMNEFLNELIETHLHGALVQCMSVFTATNTELTIYDFKQLRYNAAFLGPRL
jgi:hypothetical protein